MKLLCVADVHLGRSPARLHPDLATRAAHLGPAAAWRRAVDVALDERVNAVLLAGDLVDGGNDFFEAFSDLRQGVARLAEAGIEVVAVSGNHDVEVLPRLVAAVPQVRLLGAGGRWQAYDLEADGAAVRVVGWSFPSRWVDRSPLAAGGLKELVEGQDVVIGLLHADRDHSLSRYAPVGSAELADVPVRAWLLGHVHAPDLAHRAGTQLSGYLGSLTSNDPGEAGARGAWLLEVGPAGAIAARHVPLAPLRWERVEVDVTALGAPDELPNLIVSSLARLDERLVAQGANPVAVGCRLVLTGRTSLRAGIEQQLADAAPTRRTIEIGNITYFVDRVRVEALPALDLRELARGEDPVGLLAARIVALRQPGSALRERLLAEARPRLDAVRGHRAFSGLEAPALEENEVVELLEEAALRALDALLQQHGGAFQGGSA